MFDKLRDAFREAVDNFKEELSRDDVPEAVDRLLVGMKNEAADAQARVRQLEKDVERTLQMSKREARDAATCRRREKMARKIGDDETADVAAEFAEKHDRRREVLEAKAHALKEEQNLGKAEVTEMVEKIKQAQKDRDALSATAGRASARNTIQGAGDLFDELDRMAERIQGDDDLASASEETWRELERDDAEEGVDIDTRLDELKRRMGRD